MKLPSIFSHINNDPHLVKLLGWPFEFEMCKPYLLSKEWPILLSNELIAIAEDGSGGAYTIIEDLDPDNSPVIFVSSEGQAGKVAESIQEFISLLIALPFWRDLLKFSDSGNLEGMNKVAPFLEEDFQEEEANINDYKAYIRESLKLVNLNDPVLYLFNSVKSGTNISIRADDSSLYNELFNSFSLDDYIKWNR